MKPAQNFSDYDIACYVIGIDKPEVDHYIQAHLASDDAAAARALKWEAYFLDLVDALPKAQPPAEILLALEQSLGKQGASIFARPSPGPDHKPLTDADSGTNTNDARPPLAKSLKTTKIVLLGVLIIVIIALGLYVF